MHPECLLARAEAWVHMQQMRESFSILHDIEAGRITQEMPDPTVLNWGILKKHLSKNRGEE
eukprot:5661199-Alexandrium_andersonii.AAC.1